VVFDEVLPGVLAQAVKAPVDRAIAFLGDWYHVRYRIPVALQNRVVDWVRECGAHDVQIHLLPGNHDQIDVDGSSALDVFAEYPWVSVYAKPTQNDLGMWIPYRKDIAQVRLGLAYGLEHGAKVAWMHHGIQGAWVSRGRTDMDGVSGDALSGYTAVWCGHYHRPQAVSQRDPRVEYIGSPYQTRADESGQWKRIGVWSPARLEMDWIEVNWGPSYHYLEVVTGQEELPELRPGDQLRVRAAPGVDAVSYAKALEGRGVSVVLSQEQAQSVERLGRVDGGVEAYARAYVDQLAEGLDKERLMGVFESFSDAGVPG